MKLLHAFLSLILVQFALISGVFSQESATENAIQIDFPEILIEGVESKIIISNIEHQNIRVFQDGQELEQTFVEGEILVKIELNALSTIEVKSNANLIARKEIRPVPQWMSIIPPLLAILLALVFREVIASLFLGLFVGSAIPFIYGHGFSGIFSGFLKVIDTYIINALLNKGHLSVILFSMLIGAAVSLISKNGGMAGVVHSLSKYAKSRRSGQFVTWFLGIAIFFDDYANTLIVGNTMRPITDKLKISREKLAYIVDSTAAPIAAIAFVTTWIGAELGYIQDGIQSISGMNAGVYQIFLNSLQYSFYPIFTLIFIAILIWMKKDFGPMHAAENATVNNEHEGNQLVNVTEQEMKDFEPNEGTVERAFNAIIPIASIILVTIIGLAYTGYESSVWNSLDHGIIKKISITIGNADPYIALLWSSITGLSIAAILTLSQRILNIQETIGSIMKGFKTMLTAMIILILAWSLSAVTEDMHTAHFLTEAISGNISPYALPLVTFILAGIVSFSTGSSWGTMAILYPMMLPLTWAIGLSEGMDTPEALSIFYNVVSCVLAGSVLGDHCSPISDTTILSSLASSCNHIEHVRTQLPYALSVGAIAIIFGTIPSSFGIPFYISLFMGIIAMYFTIKKLGKEISE